MKYPWLESYFSMIASSWKQHMLPQALLLTGQKGVGKSALAFEVAQFVLCENKCDQQSSCGQCRSCHLFTVGSHPDLFSVGLEEKSRLIKIDQIRRVTDQLNKTSLVGYQVVLISPACQMNAAAANALLKTLEEPPGSVLLILSAHHWAKLPATIMSRCQRVHVSISDSSEAIAWMKSAYPQHDSTLLWKHTQGAPLWAQELIDLGYFNYCDRILSCLEQSMLSSVNPLPVVAEWLKYDVALIIRLIILIVSDCLKLALGLSFGSLVNEDQAVRLEKMAGTQSSDAWGEFYQRILGYQSLLLTGIAINVQLTLENIMLAWLDFCKVRTGV